MNSATLQTRVDAALAEISARIDALPDPGDIGAPNERERIWEERQSLTTHRSQLSPRVRKLAELESKLESLSALPDIIKAPGTKVLLKWLESEGVHPQWDQRALFTESGALAVVHADIADLKRQCDEASAALETALVGVEAFLRVAETV